MFDRNGSFEVLKWDIFCVFQSVKLESHVIQNFLLIIIDEPIFIIPNFLLIEV